MITKRKIFDRLSISFNEFFKQMFKISVENLKDENKQKPAPISRIKSVPCAE